MGDRHRPARFDDHVGFAARLELGRHPVDHRWREPRRFAEPAQAEIGNRSLRGGLSGRIDHQHDVELARDLRRFLRFPDAARLPRERDRVVRNALDQRREPLAIELGRGDRRRCRDEEAPRLDLAGHGERLLERRVERGRGLQLRDDLRKHDAEHERRRHLAPPRAKRGGLRNRCVPRTELEKIVLFGVALDVSFEGCEADMRTCHGARVLREEKAGGFLRFTRFQNGTRNAANSDAYASRPKSNQCVGCDRMKRSISETACSAARPSASSGAFFGIPSRGAT